MAKQLFSHRTLIDKANKSLILTVGTATFVVIFSLIALKTLLSQAAYQNRVISKKREAVKVLKSDISVSQQLASAYQAFQSTSNNSIGGLTDGTGPRDGSNSKIVLDALPSKYDFPALATNVEALVASQGVRLSSITGTDDEVAQMANTTSGTPTPVTMPFELSVQGDYEHTKALVLAFERSIRPMHINSISISGSQANLSTSIKAETAYQPAKTFNIKKEVIK